MRARHKTFRVGESCIQSVEFEQLRREILKLVAFRRHQSTCRLQHVSAQNSLIGESTNAATVATATPYERGVITERIELEHDHQRI
jgi:hypothetical protein